MLIADQEVCLEFYYFAAPSGPPEGVTVGDTLSTSFIVIWQPPANENQNGLILGYTVKIVDLSSSNETQIYVTETTFEVLDLMPFTLYEVAIAAHNAAGKGPFSVVITVETEESGEDFIILSIIILSIITAIYSSHFFSSYFTTRKCYC